MSQGQKRRDEKRAAIMAREQARTALYRAVFLGSPEGRKVLEELTRDACGVSRLSFAADSERLTAFNEGRRAIGLYLQEVVNGSRIPSERNNDTPRPGPGGHGGSGSSPAPDAPRGAIPA